MSTMEGGPGKSSAARAKEACIHTLKIKSIVDACGCCKSTPQQGAGEITSVCVGMKFCLLKQKRLLVEKACPSCLCNSPLTGCLAVWARFGCTSSNFSSSSESNLCSVFTWMRDNNVEAEGFFYR